jgi:hypothetical protein
MCEGVVCIQLAQCGVELRYFVNADESPNFMKEGKILIRETLQVHRVFII